MKCFVSWVTNEPGTARQKKKPRRRGGTERFRVLRAWCLARACRSATPQHGAPKLRPTMQCQVGPYFLSNSFLMCVAMSFSMLYFSSAWRAPGA